MKAHVIKWVVVHKILIISNMAMDMFRYSFDGMENDPLVRGNQLTISIPKKYTLPNSYICNVLFGSKFRLRNDFRISLLFFGTHFLSFLT